MNRGRKWRVESTISGLRAAASCRRDQSRGLLIIAEKLGSNE